MGECGEDITDKAWIQDITDKVELGLGLCCLTIFQLYRGGKARLGFSKNTNKYY
jgi:hypothetical protein